MTTNDLASLAALDAAHLGSGAQAFVLSTGKSYRLLNSSFVTTLSPVTIRASDNSGTWFQEDAGFDQAFLVYAVASSSFVNVTQNVWSALPSDVGLYTSSVPAACWSVNSTTGIVTYNGPQAQFMARAYLSLAVTAENIKSWEFDISRNGNIIGTTSISVTSTGADSNDVGALWCCHMLSVVIVPPGTSYQMAMRTLSLGPLPVGILKYQLSFQLMP